MTMSRTAADTRAKVRSEWSGLPQNAEPVVGIPGTRRQAAARRGRGPPDVVPPGPAPARTPLSRLGSPGCHLGRRSVVARVVPVEAPLVDDRADVEQAVAVRPPAADRPRSVERAHRH